MNFVRLIDLDILPSSSCVEVIKPVGSLTIDKSSANDRLTTEFYKHFYQQIFLLHDFRPGTLEY